MASFGFDTSGKQVAEHFSSQIKGRTFVITGPSSGSVAAIAATDLAREQPARLILAGRTKSKIEPVIAQIHDISPETKVDFVHLDLSDQNSVRKAASEIQVLTSKIHVLFNNAGIMANKEYTTTSQDIELQLGTNYIGHFLLTNLVLPQIIAAGSGARIVSTSSNGYMLSGVRYTDYNFDSGKNYNPWLAYAQSKTAIMLFTLSLAEKLKAKGITSFAVTPGLVLESNLQADVAPELFAQGIETYKEVFAGRDMPPLENPKPMVAADSTLLVAALDPHLEGQSGAYLENCKVNPKIEAHAQGQDLSQQLWDLSNRLVGEKFAL